MTGTREVAVTPMFESPCHFCVDSSLLVFEGPMCPGDQCPINGLEVRALFYSDLFRFSSLFWPNRLYWKADALIA